MMNYTAAFNYVKSIPSHPALISDTSFKGWCDALVAALNKPDVEAPKANVATFKLPEPATDKNITVLINVDGVVAANPGNGGYGAVTSYRGSVKELQGVFENATSNQAELLAVIAVLQAMKRPMAVHLTSPSAYFTKNIKNIETWQKSGWQRGKKPIVNAETWQKLAELIAEKCTALTVECIQHGCDDCNSKRATELAKQAAGLLQA